MFPVVVVQGSGDDAKSWRFNFSAFTVLRIPPTLKKLLAGRRTARGLFDHPGQGFEKLGGAGLANLSVVVPVEVGAVLGEHEAGATWAGRELDRLQ